MAITATVNLGAQSSGTISNNQRIKGTVSVTNGNSTPVEVLSINLWASRTGQTANSVSNNDGSSPEINLMVPMTGSVSRLVNNSATSYYPFETIFYSPRQGTTLTNPATQQYDLGATVYTSDGSTTAATVNTVTITALST